MRPDVPVLAVLLIAASVAAGHAELVPLHPSQTTLLDPTTGPVRLEAGGDGVTLVNAHGTAATSEVDAPGALREFEDVLHVSSRATVPHLVTLHLLGVEAPERLRDLEMTLHAAGGSARHVSVEDGDVLQAVDNPVTLQPGETVRLSIAARHPGKTPSILHLEFRIQSSNAPGAEVAYPYTLTVT